ncbi:fimbrial protein [Pseudomonas gingeri]|uniref:fimbrial protein n=1 Tax=Pseudomonas gingeri TaxID=117681 RepID=UPI0015A4398D|nr:fimbrial protein [Pseudomonas gingeri]NWD74515.1 fimbrial protein [Pseudomonas gingeri]
MIVRILLSTWLGCLSLQAHALVGGNVDCSMPGYPTFGYRFTPGEAINVEYAGTCTIRRAFPYAAGINTSVSYGTGANHATLRFADPASSTYVPLLDLGQFSGICLGGACQKLPINSVVRYRYNLIGTAPRTTGTRTLQVRIGVTSLNYPTYAEWFVDMPFVYTVFAPACTLSSPSSVSLRFGAISNAGLRNQVQSTSVSLSCKASAQANITLAPSQAVVSATTGVSRTSLAGLNMQALWTDSGNPVNFTSQRYMPLRSGSNNVNLSFIPQLEAGKSPTGAFQSQYTLTINYL